MFAWILYLTVLTIYLSCPRNLFYTTDYLENFQYALDHLNFRPIIFYHINKNHIFSDILKFRIYKNNEVTYNNVYYCLILSRSFIFHSRKLIVSKKMYR